MENLPKLLEWLLIAACVGSGMMAGLFFAFSTFMMKALANLSDSNGIKAMQAINRTIVRPSFLFVFLGTGILCSVLVLLSWITAPDLLPLTGAAALFYIVCCILSTVLFNIPLNNELETIDPNSAEGHDFWRHYLSKWTRWNHVRSVATLCCTLLLASAIANQS